MLYRWIVDLEPQVFGSFSYNPHMTTLRNRLNTALLVVDVQNGVVKEAHERDAVLANIGLLVTRARQDRIPVIWIQHSDEHLPRGTDRWQIVPELTPGTSEPLVEKNYGDAFENTNLEALLSDLGVGKLFVVGAQTDACIRSTIHGAFVRGYDVILVSDAHTTENQTAGGAPPPDQIIAFTNLYWRYQLAPGRTAGTVATSAVQFGSTTAK
jgi:isochorismate hydrolase